jgi:hypothetical protein
LRVRTGSWLGDRDCPARAADGPFGGTIAHGLLTLSLMPRFMQQMYRVDNIAMGINYGYNKVRFITPVCVGARVRARAVIDTITNLDGTVQAVATTTVTSRAPRSPLRWPRRSSATSRERASKLRTRLRPDAIQSPVRNLDLPCIEIAHSAVDPQAVRAPIVFTTACRCRSKASAHGRYRHRQREAGSPRHNPK